MDDDHTAGPSTRRLDLLPTEDRLLRACRALAMVEAGLNDNPVTRWHMVASNEAQECICRVSDGSGNEALIWFGPDGAVIRGFDHESEMSPWVHDPVQLWPGLDEGFPPALRPAPTIEVAGIESVTFLIWRSAEDRQWSIGSIELPVGDSADPDGSEYLLRAISRPVEGHRFLEEYYEREVSRVAVEQLFQAVPLTHELLEQIGAVRHHDDVFAEARVIGYPVAP